MERSGGTRRVAVAVATAVAVLAASAVAPITGAAAETPESEPDVVVTSTAADGPGSLTAVVAATNATVGVRETITFDLPDDGPHAIVTSGIDITDAVVLDATTQPGYTDTPLVALAGDGTGVGIDIAASDVDVRGLEVRDFDTGIAIRTGASRNTVRESVVVANRATGILVEGPTEEEVAALIAEGEVDLAALMALMPTDNVIAGNRIGVDADGADRGNGDAGVAFVRAGKGLLGGTAADDSNVIAHNAGPGVAVTRTTGVTIRGNAIRSNGALGIVIDTGDPNQPPPVPPHVAASERDGTFVVTGSVTGDANSAYRVEVFANTPCSEGEGRESRAWFDVTTDGAGTATFERDLASAEGIAAVTATATDTQGTTSEFSPCSEVVLPAPDADPTPSPPSAPRLQAESEPLEDPIVLAAETGPCTATFTAAVDNRLAVAGNWDTGVVPSSTDTACIPAGRTGRIDTGALTFGELDTEADSIVQVAGTGTFTVQGAAAVDGALHLSGGSLVANGAMSVAFFDWSNGSLNGSGEVTVLDAAWTGSDKYLRTDLRIEGTATWTGGSLVFDAVGASFTVGGAPGATLTADVSATDFGVSALTSGNRFDVLADGAVRLGGDSVTDTFQISGTAWQVAGAFDVTRARLHLNASGVAMTHTGTVRLRNGAEWYHSAGTVTFAGGTLTQDGAPDSTVRLETGADLRFDATATYAVATTRLQVVNGVGGILRITRPQSFANLHIDGGHLHLTADATATNFTWSHGSLNGPGDLTVPTGATATWTGSTKYLRTDLRIEGTALWTGGSLYRENDGASVTADLVVTGDLVADSAATLGTPVTIQGVGRPVPRTVIGSEGSLEKRGAGTLQVDTAFENRGQVIVSAGEVDLRRAPVNLSGTTLSDGIWRVESARLRMSGANVVTNDAQIVLNGTGAAFVDQSGNAALRNLGTNRGALTLEAGHVLATPALRNEGFLWLHAGTRLTVGGDFTQTATGTYRAEVAEATPESLVRVTGTAHLDGTLEVDVIPVFAPAPGTSYRIIDAAALDGTFATTLGVGEDLGGSVFDLVYDTPDGDVLLDVAPFAISVTVGNVGDTAEGAGTVSLPVTLSYVPPRDVEFIVVAESTSAREGLDFALQSGTVTVPAGSRTASIAVTILDDDLTELSETVDLRLTGSDAYAQAIVDHEESDATGQVTILDDEPRATLTIPDLTVVEGEGTVVLTAELDRPVGYDLTLVFNGTVDPDDATTPDDYSAAGTFTIPAGEVTAHFEVSLVDDRLQEADELATILVYPIDDAPWELVTGFPDAHLRIIDDDWYVVIHDREVREDEGPARLTVELERSFPVDMRYFVVTTGGTATESVDYLPPDFYVVVPAGEVSAPVVVDLLDDDLTEPTETVEIGIAGADAFAAGLERDPLSTTSAVLTITDDEARATMTIPDLTVAEDAGTVTLTATLDRPVSHDLTLVFNGTVDPDGATTPDDYTAAGTFTIAAGELTARFDAAIVDDDVPEVDEVATILVYPIDDPPWELVTGFPDAHIRIVDNDPPAATVTVDPVRVPEPFGSDTSVVQLTARLSRPLDDTVRLAALAVGTDPSPITVPDDASDRGGIDATFAPGETTVQFEVTIHGDDLVEGDETGGFGFLAQDDITEALVGPVIETGTVLAILDDDDPPAATVTIDSVRVPEPVGAGTAVVRLTARLSRPLDDTVSLAVLPFGTGPSPVNPHEDVADTSAQLLRFAPGQTTVQLPITILGDDLVEGDETAGFGLFAYDEITYAVLGSAIETATVLTILDDDDPSRASLTIDPVSVEEDAGGPGADHVVPMTLRLSAPLPDPVILHPALVGTGTAPITERTDATGATLDSEEWVAIPAGETTASFPITIHDDDLAEGDETGGFVVLALGDVSIAHLDLTTETGTVLTIVDDDDDEPPEDDDIPRAVEEGSGEVFDVLGSWGEAFNLDSWNADPDTALPEQPVLTDDLGDLFALGQELGELPNPLEGAPDALDEFLDHAEALGFEIDWVAGGIGGRPTPPTDDDLFQATWTKDLADLSHALSFTGDTFNDEQPGVLAGLSEGNGLDGALEPTADLRLTLVLGVDTDGFYLADRSGARLTASADGSISGLGDVAGRPDLSLGGAAHADLDIALGASRGGSRLRAADLAASAARYLVPEVEGTAHLEIDVAFPPVALTWTADATATAGPDRAVTVDYTTTLDGALTLPGFTVPGAEGDATPAEFRMTGTYTSDDETWRIHGEGAVDSDYAVNGFTLDALAFDATITPLTFSGTGRAALGVDLGNPDVPVTIALDAAFDAESLHVEGHADLDAQTIGTTPALLHLDDTDIDATFDARLDTGALTGGLTVRSGTAVVLPDPAPPGATPTGVVTTTGLVGSLDHRGNLDLTVDRANGHIAGVILFDVTGAEVHLGPDGTGPVFAADTVVARVPRLNDLEVTITGLHLERDGRFGASRIDVQSQGFVETIGLGGILPFEITQVTLDFPDLDDLNTFDVTVVGRFEFTPLAALPFTPILGLGAGPVTPDSPPEDNRFTFSLAVESLAEGRIRPKDLGPITLGFADLELPGATLGADLTLGGYRDGVFDPSFTGSLSVLGGLEDIEGEATVEVDGAITTGADGTTVAFDARFELSARLGEYVELTDASLTFDMAITVAPDFAMILDGPHFDGARIGAVALHFGEYMTLRASDVDVDLDPEPGGHVVAFGGTLADPGLEAVFGEGLGPFAGWGGGAGNFAVDADLDVVVLPGVFVTVDVGNERFGLPEWLPLHVDEVGVKFDQLDDLAQIPEEGIELADLADFTVRFSGGLVATDEWPISVAVDGLEVDLGKLARGEFPITNLDGLMFGVEPFPLGPVTIGGGFGLGVVRVERDDGTEVTAFYGRIFGELELDGIGFGVDLVVTQYGPVLLELVVPVPIPLGTTGFAISQISGGIKFGGEAFPPITSPVEMLTEPEFDTEFRITPALIAAAVRTAALADDDDPLTPPPRYTWNDGFTVALRGKVIHAALPGIISGQLTLGANVGFDPGEGLKLIGKGEISVFGMPLGVAGVLVDLHDPIAPRLDVAFRMPAPGNPLAFLLPGVAEAELTIDTRGVALGLALGTRAFVEQLASGTLDVAQDLFADVLDTLAAELERNRRQRLDDGAPPRSRLFVHRLLDLDGDGSVSPAEDARTITADFLVDRLLGRDDVPALFPLGPDGLPTDLRSAVDAATQFTRALQEAAVGILAAGHADLAAIVADPDLAVFLDALGAGSEAAAAMSGVVRDALASAGDAFFSQFDPSLVLRSRMQPVVLGIPFGEPAQEVELIVDSRQIGFGFRYSFARTLNQSVAMSLPIVGPAASSLSLLTLGFEDDNQLSFSLPISGLVESLLTGRGFPAIDPFSGQWSVTGSGYSKVFGTKLADLSAVVVPAGNRTAVDARVSKIFAGEADDPDKIPIQRQEHYDALLAYGGILLHGKMEVPRALTDPVTLLTELDLEPPDDPLGLFAWLERLAADGTAVDTPIRAQIFLPSLGSLLQTNFDDYMSDADRVTFADPDDPELLDKLTAILGSAYFEGTWDGTVLSVPVGQGIVEASVDGITVETTVDLLGVDLEFVIDTTDVVDPGGATVADDFPRIKGFAGVDSARIATLLRDKLGLPDLFVPDVSAEHHVAFWSPGYDVASDNRLEQVGGIELGTTMAIDGLIDDAAFSFAITPPLPGQLLPDFVATARADVGPIAGIEIRDALVEVRREQGALSVLVDGEATILGVAARVHGELNPDLTGTLVAELRAAPDLGGFALDAALDITITRDDTGALQARTTFDGDVVLPPWLALAAGFSSAHASGELTSDGTLTLHVEVTDLTIHGFTFTDASLTLVEDDTGARLDVAATVPFLGAALVVDGSLSLGPDGPSGSLTVTLPDGQALALGPATVVGSLRLDVTPTAWTLAVTGTLTVPGITGASGLTVTGTLQGDGTGSLALTAPAFTVGLFTITAAPGDPPPALATFTRTPTALTLTVDGRLAFLGTTLAVSGELMLTASGPDGNLQLRFSPGEALDFGPVTVDGTVLLQVRPTSATVRVNGSADVPGIANDLAVTGTVNSDGTGSLTVSATSLSIGGFTISRIQGERAGGFTIVRTATTTSLSVRGRVSFLGATLVVSGNLTLGPTGPTGNLTVTVPTGTTLAFGAVTLRSAVLTLVVTPTGASVSASALADVPGVGTGLGVAGTVTNAGTGTLAVNVATLTLGGFTLARVPGQTAIATITRTPTTLTMTVDARVTVLGNPLDVDGTLSLAPSGPSGNLTITVPTATTFAFGVVTLRSAAMGLAITPTSASISASALADVPGVATGLGVAGTVNANGTGSLALTATSLSLKGFALTRVPGVSPPPPVATIVRTPTTLTMTVDARLAFAGASVDVDGSLTLAIGGPSGTLAVTFAGSANVPFGGWTLEGGVALAVAPATASITVAARLDVPGLASDLAVSGTLDSSILGSLSVSAGSLPLGVGSSLSISGTLTLSRTDPDGPGGAAPVISLTATNVALAWSGVPGTFAVGTFSIGTDGHFDATTAARTVTVGQFAMAFPAAALHVGPNATAVSLTVGPSSLTISNVQSTPRTYSVPGFAVATNGTFSVALTSTDIDFAGIDVDGRLLFERAGGAFRLRIVSIAVGDPPNILVPGFARLDVDEFTLSSDATFDVAIRADRLGPDALSIRRASLRLTKSSLAFTSVRVQVDGGSLYLPVGTPIPLPDIDIDGTGAFSRTFSATSLGLGPALTTVSDPSFTFSLANGVFDLDLTNDLPVTVLPSSVDMTLRALHVRSDGTFDGEVRGRLALLGFTLATATFDVSVSSGLLRMSIPSSRPVSVALGSTSASVSGVVRSDGRFDLSGSATVDLRVLGIGPLGTATVRLRNTGLSGTFTGSVCLAIVGCAQFAALAIGNDGAISGSVVGVSFTYSIFTPGTVAADTTPPLFKQVSDIRVVADLPTDGKATVSFTVTATDNVDDTPTVTCSPASGSKFAVGTTTVTCTARDDARNSSTRTFTVTVVDSTQ